MNDLFVNIGIARWKPLVTAMLLPPVPFLLLALIALLVIGRRRRWGTAMLITSISLIWLSCCTGMASALGPWLLRLPAALTEERMSELKREAGKSVAIIVLGAGVEDCAPEYHTSNLSPRSLERLRYGIWLGRRTGWPTGFTGGIGWGQSTSKSSVAEATVAQRIASEEFGRPLRWVESESRDTRENAVNTVALLSAQGVRRIVLVTHSWHMPRAVRNFERADRTKRLDLIAAPMGLASDMEIPLLRWFPSGDGLNQTRVVVREWLGLLSGA